jgi:abhydrolase domain-containing protein 12
MEWKTSNGVIREEILKTDKHDTIMGYPVVTMAIMRLFSAFESSLACQTW